MEELKTETVVVNGTSKVKFSNPNPTIQLTNNQTRSIQLETQPEAIKTVKQRWEEIKEEAHDTRKVTHINPYASYFPEFYKKEIRNSFVMFIFWTIIFILTLASIGTTIYFIIMDSGVLNQGAPQGVSPYISFLLLPPLVLIAALWIVYLNKFYCFRGEAKTINFKEEKTLSINVLKLYKRLKTGHININWMSLTSYVVFLLVILINFIVAYAMYRNYGFGRINMNGISDADYPIYITFIYVFWVSVAILLGTIVIQASLLVGNYIRVARIENFYNFMIVPQEELDIIKKQKNRRDLVIFLCAILLIGLIGYLIYRLVKRNRATKVVVS